jgi:uncharacterized protein (TIGR03000 family)
LGGCAGAVIGAPVVPGVQGAPVETPAPPSTAPKVMPKSKEKVPTDTSRTEAPATILVTLPAEARLTVDGFVTHSTTANRVFVSPNLQLGRDYVYTLRAEVVRDGQTVAQEQRVTVRAGEETRVPFQFAPAGVASR